eukprot:CAMPEP_0169171636 /NCGR_PEP_ID=MMETSP1015-20121227/62849_1 /TAXON_ID=342587 /ORGANISM="Karlodinium micrum, Strain CCMP2283" /LENGTH=32 /DNA_ID= /DNA_START= /DNA_END= /DNA_ORIENTATION=
MPKPTRKEHELESATEPTRVDRLDDVILSNAA